MKITNKTVYDTRQIAALAHEVCRRELLGPDFTKRLKIVVQYGRGGAYRTGYGGWAYYHSHFMTIKLPRPGNGGPASIDCVRVAKIIAHEAAHCQGVRHANMKEARYSWAEGWREVWAWASDYRIEPMPPKAKARPTKTEKDRAQIAKCEKACEQWQRRIKLARTWLSKWQRRLKYYQKRAKLAEERGQP